MLSGCRQAFCGQHDLKCKHTSSHMFSKNLKRVMLCNVNSFKRRRSTRLCCIFYKRHGTTDVLGIPRVPGLCQHCSSALPLSCGPECKIPKLATNMQTAHTKESRWFSMVFSHLCQWMHLSHSFADSQVLHQQASLAHLPDMQIFAGSVKDCTAHFGGHTASFQLHL